MALTPFQAYLGRPDFVEVGMNDLSILLPGTGKRAIGKLLGVSAAVLQLPYSEMLYSLRLSLHAEILSRPEKSTSNDICLAS